MTSKGISLCLMAKSDLITSFLNERKYSMFFCFLGKTALKRLFSLDKWRNCTNFVLEKRQTGAFVV